MLSTVLNPECITTLGLASSHSARRYFGNLFWFLFLRLLRCFSSAGLPRYTYFIQHNVSEYCSDGFPHSEIHVSPDICSSSWLIAACHVLLRLLMPRHSSYALLSLTSRLRFFALPSVLSVLRSLVLLLLYVSKLLLLSLDTFAFSFKHFCYPFSIWKNLFLIFFLLFLLYSVFKQQLRFN